MPKYVLSYFDFPGRGEPARMLLAYGGEGFVDNRVTYDEWKEYKPKTPFGQMPVLDIDGKKYAQSIPIARYLGHKYGLAGADLEEDFVIDQNVQFLFDLTSYKPPVNNNRFLVEKLSEIVTKNNGHLALGRLTWGDFVFAGLFDFIMELLRMPDLKTKYPSFKKLIDKVESLPKVRAYLDGLNPLSNT